MVLSTTAHCDTLQHAVNTFSLLIRGVFTEAACMCALLSKKKEENKKVKENTDQQTILAGIREEGGQVGEECP